MRIDKLLANSGFGTRTEVKKLLKTGIVAVDNTVVLNGKFHVYPNVSSITVGGEQVDYKEFVYFMMNKPQGYISATEDRRLQTVLELLKPEHSAMKPFPAGRLDRDTEGFLLLTNDGQLAHQLLSPRKHVTKRYYAIVDGEVTSEDIVLFQQGVQLDDGYVAKEAHLEILTSGQQSEIELTITEGKFHQVKRMFEAIGKKVVYLKRISIGPLSLDPALALGQYRALHDQELTLLQSTTNQFKSQLLSKQAIKFYTKEGCHLCDEALQLLHELQQSNDFSIEIIDIYASDELVEKFSLMIPVVELDEEVIQFGQIDRGTVLEKLENRPD